MTQQVVEAVSESLLAVWTQFIEFIPQFIGALIVLIIGLIVAAGLGSLVERVVSTLKIDDLLRRVGLGPYFERARLQINTGKFLGALVYWFFVIVFVSASANVLGIEEFSRFLNVIASYIPNIIAAVLIVLASVVLANFLRGLVRASVMSARLQASKFLGTLSWWATVVFGIWVALIQLGVVPDLLKNILSNIVLGIVAALAIAFGLGGKDYAAHLINKLREHTE